MKTVTWQHAFIRTTLLVGLAMPAFAQEAAVANPAAAAPIIRMKEHSARNQSRRGPGTERFLNKLEHTVGLTPEQRDAVRGLLAQQHEELKALHGAGAGEYKAVKEKTNDKIRELLNAEQKQKFDALIAQQKEWHPHKRRGA